MNDSAAQIDRFQYEHIAALVLRESAATGRTPVEILDAIRAEIENRGGFYDAFVASQGIESTTAAVPCGTCWRCGGTLYEYLVHHCTTNVRLPR